MAGLPGAKAGFGSLKPIIEQVYKDLLERVPMQVKQPERTK
jgi:hypothetical protein